MIQTLRLPGEVPAKKNKQRAYHLPNNRIGIRKADEVRIYEDMVSSEVIGQRMRRVEAPIIMGLELVYRKNRDIDGALTTIMDCLQIAGVYDNDMDIVEFSHLRKRKANKGEIAHALITLATILPDEVP